MSKTLTGLCYRLEPNPGHERVLAQSSGACRWLWNWALAYREDLWLAAKSAGAVGLAASAGYVHLSSLLPGLKEHYPWLSRAPHHALQHVLRDLDKAFSRFFSGTSGYPRFKRRGDRDSVHFPDSKQFSIEGDWVKLPKFGWVRFRLSRPIAGKVRYVTLSREGKSWNVSFCVEGDFARSNEGLAPVALDLGAVASVAQSNGIVESFPVATPAEEKRLRWLARQASGQKRGSVRHRRTLDRQAKLRRHIANRRRDAAHKLTTRLASGHGVVVVEGLNIKKMTASARGTLASPGTDVKRVASRNRKFLANAHSDLRRMLAYKCERSGARLVAVNPAYTSQTCSRCRHCAPENRKSQAVFLCVACGLNINADINAALNILAAGLAVIARGGSGNAPADEPRTHPRVRRKSAGSTGIPAKAASSCLDREEVNLRHRSPRRP
jgi:putative transposase